jgi:SAM-dependent methyltransferase
LLYSNHDETEAEEFIENLLVFLNPQKGSLALDLACGKGRHAIALHKHGLDVTGIDLSEKSINEAKKHEGPGLSFAVHDMRQAFMINYFDYTFNLFTSFGYFSNQRDNASVIKAVKSGLKKGGVFVIDFFNSSFVKRQVETTHSGLIESGGIQFSWKKRIENNFVLKDISFEAERTNYFFTEQVQLLSLTDFEKLLSPFFIIENVFGDYKLGKFVEENSPRLIIIARKK